MGQGTTAESCESLVQGALELSHLRSVQEVRGLGWGTHPMAGFPAWAHTAVQASHLRNVPELRELQGVKPGALAAPCPWLPRQWPPHTTKV